MPTSERTARAAGRCETHPSRPALQACDSCGRPLCLTCAIPVRGRVLGAECLGPIIGPVQEEEAPGPRSFRSAAVVAGTGFLVAVAATLLPWSAPSYSHYTGPFGGWGFSPLAWSLLASAAALLGAMAWVLLGRWRGFSGRGAVATAALALLSAAGAVLYLAHPPFATRPWLGPWVLLAGCAAGFGGAIAGMGRLGARTPRATSDVS